MTDYIDRETALLFPFANGRYDHENANPNFIFGCESYREYLEKLPAADVRPVVRGEWGTMGDNNIRCSICKHRVPYFSAYQKWFSDYCPNCGADMRKENE